MSKKDELHTSRNPPPDADIAALIDEARQLDRNLRRHKRIVLRNYLIPTALIVGVFIQIIINCNDCDVAQVWIYYVFVFWIACPFAVYFFLRTRYRLWVKIRRETKKRKQIMAEIHRFYGLSSGAQNSG